MNTADPRAIRKARQKEKQQRREELKDLQDVLSTKAGRRVIWKILSRAGVFRVDWEAGNHGYNDLCTGRRTIGNELMSEIQAIDPELYVTMAREANETPTEPEEEKHDE